MWCSVSCPACAAGFPYECYSPDNPCSKAPVADFLKPDGEKRGGAIKADEDVTDPKSTGRKRAALLFPLDTEESCEWRGLKTAGGGKHPIVGCVNGVQKNRHHGPDKDTLNNEQGNVHRICAHCHNRWHAANDSDYDPLSPDNVPHDPVTRATELEIVENELYWNSRKLTKVKD